MLSRLQLIAALLALLLGIVVCGRASAQDARQEQRLVSREEGQAIAQAALQHWPQVHDKPDCSHLVHDVYAEAGLDYEYAITDDIFDGIDRFQRVQIPQAGDLVVWSGHVGIVIDPADTSFYSSVITGFSVSSFTSSYWVSRGPRRFYRYMINSLQSTQLLDLFAVRKPHLTAAAGSAAYEPKFISDRETSESDKLDTEGGSARRAVSQPVVRQSFSQGPDANLRQKRAPDIATSTTRMPAQSAKDSPARNKPTREAIRSAFVQLSDSRAQELQESSFLNAPIEIVDSFELMKMETQGGSGWVELKIRKIASFADGRMRLSSIESTETIRFNLLRQAEGWILLDSANRTYLLRHAAIKMIAGRLAALAKNPDNEEELKPLTKALGILLAEDRS